MKILCKIGWHHWKYSDGKRQCRCCPKTQTLDEEAELEWGVTLWIDE